MAEDAGQYSNPRTLTAMRQYNVVVPALIAGLDYRRLVDVDNQGCRRYYSSNIAAPNNPVKHST